MSDASRTIAARSPIRWIGVAACAAGVFGVVWLLSPAPPMVEAASTPRVQPAGVEWRVAEACKQLKVLTSVIQSRLLVRASDDNWRGVAVATIEVPVRIHFGVDLATLSPESIRRGSDGSFILQLPKPRRLSVEVLPEIGEPRVEVGWGRWKSWAGEQMIADARKKALEQAQTFVADAADMAQVRRQTSEQIEHLVQLVAGPQAKVRVEFVDEK